MRKKFGRYTINVFDKKKKKQEDGSIAIEATLTGCIEIGLEIDRYTWREDWFLKLFFGDEAHEYELLSLENNDSWSKKTIITEINIVKAVVRKRAARLL